MEFSISPFKKNQPLGENSQTRPLARLSLILRSLAALASCCCFGGALAEERPYVAGFERFHRRDAAGVGAGNLLLNELQCAACHAASDNSTAANRKAPSLNEVGSRSDPNFLRDFIIEPHVHQPGTTMPRMMNDLTEPERTAAANAIVNYLLSKKNDFERFAPDRAAVARGNELYHSVGCVACHAPQNGDVDPELLAQSRLFPKLEDKYSHAGLQRFLSDPLRVRQSGRMPHMNLIGREASDIAHYLLRDTYIAAPLQYELFHGRRRNLKDQGQLELAKTGNASGFDLEFPHRNSNYTVRLSGFLLIDVAGDYTFHLSADDGAQLFLEDEQVIDNDSPRSNDKVRVGKATVSLRPGVHSISVLYFQRGREQVLKLEWEGPGITRQPIPDTALRNSREPIKTRTAWQYDATMVETGRIQFLQHGCNNCHQLERLTDPQPAALSLAAVGVKKGCLNPQQDGRSPDFRFDQGQRTAIRSAITHYKKASHQPPGPQAPEADVRRWMERLNCYACHDRNSVGGVADNRRSLFSTTSIELGDEGRIPPSITNVGDKLREPWLEEVLWKRGIARPYMNARMPQFGEQQVRHLPRLMVAADRRESQVGESPDSADVAKEVALRLVDKGRLQCIACHDFNGHESIGIRAMDLTKMPERLNRDWFHRYMLDPNKYRPGTKMPASWPFGRTLFEDELGGSAFRQIDAIWTYLSDGRRAIPPKGLNRKSLKLIVGGEAVVYRNKIREAGFRGICVGHPEQVNFSFDAVTMRLAQIWKGRFLNVSAHWNVQGMGRVGPLGHDVITFPEGGPFAILKDLDENWPESVGKPAGYQFRGYDLGELQRPTFRYEFAGHQIADFSAGTESENRKTLSRRLTIKGRETGKLWFRAWAGDKVEPENDGFLCDKKLRIRIQSTATPEVRENSGRAELLVPVRFKDGKTGLTIDYEW